MAILGKLFGRKRPDTADLPPIDKVPDLFAPDLKDIRDEAQRLITVFGRLIEAESIEGNVETGQFKELSDATIKAAALSDEFDAAIAYGERRLRGSNVSPRSPGYRPYSTRRSRASSSPWTPAK